LRLGRNLLDSGICGERLLHNLEYAFQTIFTPRARLLNATGWSSLPTESVGVIRADTLFDASIKFLCTPRFPQQWAWGRIIGSLFPGVAGDVQHLEGGAHLCRALVKSPPRWALKALVVSTDH
jgi:hypothetical protein